MSHANPNGGDNWDWEVATPHPVPLLSEFPSALVWQCGPGKNGQALRRIETAMQRMELSLLTKLPGIQLNLITAGQPVILELAVKTTNAQDSRFEIRGSSSLEVSPPRFYFG